MTTTQRKVYSDTVKVRIYLEGVLFPYAKSVTVTESEGTVSAQIELPPSIHLKPDQLEGMVCHIFYANKRVLTYLADDPGDNSPPIGDGWPILFQGECAGETSSTTVQSENIILTFVSLARHFEQTQLYFYDTSRQQNVIDLKRQATFLGNMEIQTEASGTALSKKTRILTTLTRRIGELEADENRNIAFTATVLELLRSTGEQHAIYGVFDRKFKLSKRFAAYIDPDVKNILKLETLKTLIETRAAGLPSFASLMQLLDIPTSLMKYNWNQLAQPRLRPSRLPGNQRRGDNASDISARVRAATKQFANQVFNGGNRINTSLGAINVPSDYLSSLDTGKKAEAQSSGYIELSTFVNDIFVQYQALLGSSQNSEIDPSVLLRSAFQSQINLYKFPTVGRIAEEKKKEEPSTEEDLDDVAEEIVTTPSGDEEQDKAETQTLLDVDQASLVERDELNEFTITPNMEFMQPPACNVLFPASFGSYGITRNHFQEPTRLYGRVDLMPSSRDANNTAIEWYIAPLAQAYHYLDGDNLARFSPAYEDFLNGLPNQLVEPPENEAEPVARASTSSSAPSEGFQASPPDNEFVGPVQSSVVAGGERIESPQNLKIRSYADDPSITSFETSKYKRVIPPDEIIVHESVTRSASDTQRILHKRGLGTHFFIDENGGVIQFNDHINDRLNHGGPHNKRSVAIEVINPYVPEYLREGSVWDTVIENAQWAWKKQYVVPTPQQAESLSKLIAWLTTPASGTAVPRNWIGLSGNEMSLGRVPGAKKEAPGIYAHGYYAHSDGYWPVLYSYLRLEKGLSVSDAYNQAIELTTGTRGPVSV